MAILTQSRPLFRPNLQLWVILSHIGVKRFEKVGKLKKVADVPPSTGMKKLDTGQSDILVLADVPPLLGMEKLDAGQSDILVLAVAGMKKLDTGQSDILVLADVPPHQEWKSWMQVKVTFWF